MIKVYEITPLPYVRRTRNSHWKCERAKIYHAYLNALRLMRFDYQEGWGISFHIPMPESWSKKKRAEMLGQPVRQKKRNDLDNLIKAALDSLDYDDGLISEFGPMRKVWSEHGRIVVHLYRVEHYFNQTETVENETLN